MSDGDVVELALNALFNALMPEWWVCFARQALVDDTAVPWCEGKLTPWIKVACLVVNIAKWLGFYGE